MFYQLSKLIPKKNLFEIYKIFSMFFLSMMFETVSLISMVPFFQILFRNFDINNYINSLEILTFELNFNQSFWIVFFIFFLLIIFSLKAAFLSFFSYKVVNLIKDLKIYFPSLLFEKYLKKNYSFHLNKNSSFLIRNITETEHVATYMNSFIILSHELIIFSSLLIILFFYMPIITLTLIFTLIPVTLTFFLIIKKRSKNWGQLKILSFGKRLQDLNEGLTGIKDLKIFKKETEFHQNFKKNTTRMNYAEMKQSFLESLPKLWIEWFLVVGFLSIPTISLIYDLSSDKILTITILFAMTGYRAMPSLVRILQSYQTLTYYKPILKITVNDLKKIKKIKKKLPNFKGNFKDKLVMKNISFSFNSKKIFENLNFQVKKGSAIGIIGESGVGKTTFANILLGLIKPDKGKIFIDDENITHKYHTITRFFGYVPQDLFLIDNTIKNNIAFTLNDNEINKGKILKSIYRSQLSSLIKKNKTGINTNVGEKGIKISGGQKQRLGIARALYSDAKILIFDESTSALDKETEKKIINELSKLKKVITIIFITHRQSSLSFCDEVYKIENKKIIKI